MQDTIPISRPDRDCRWKRIFPSSDPVTLSTFAGPTRPTDAPRAQIESELRRSIPKDFSTGQKTARPRPQKKSLISNDAVPCVKKDITTGIVVTADEDIEGLKRKYEGKFANIVRVPGKGEVEWRKW